MRATAPVNSKARVSKGNRKKAAKLLSLPYKAFRYRLDKHGLGNPVGLLND